MEHFKPQGLQSFAISANSIVTHPQDAPEKMAEKAKALGASCCFGVYLLIAAPHCYMNSTQAQYIVYLDALYGDFIESAHPEFTSTHVCASGGF